MRRFGSFVVVALMVTAFNVFNPVASLAEVLPVADGADLPVAVERQPVELPVALNKSPSLDLPVSARDRDGSRYPVATRGQAPETLPVSIDRDRGAPLPVDAQHNQLPVRSNEDRYLPVDGNGVQPDRFPVSTSGRFVR